MLYSVWLTKIIPICYILLTIWTMAARAFICLYRPMGILKIVDIIGQTQNIKSLRIDPRQYLEYFEHNRNCDSQITVDHTR